MNYGEGPISVRVGMASVAGGVGDLEIGSRDGPTEAASARDRWLGPVPGA